MWVINCAGSAQYREGGNILKKLLGLALMAMLAFGGASAFAADAPACTGPVSLDCDVDGDGDEDCDIYVSVPEGGVELCEVAPSA